MKQLTLILSILFCLKNFANESTFRQANEEYNKGNYSKAITLYDSIISNNLESSELYYNLGNCYYKTQDWANTVWHYEKSLKLNPNNYNAIHNLQLTKIKIKDQIETLPEIFYKKWWGNFTSLTPTKIWQILLIISIWVILFHQLIKRIFDYKNIYLTYLLNILLLILICVTYSSNLQYNKKEAVIFSKSVIVNSAPTVNSTNLFSLNSGTKIEVIDKIGDWINIKIINGNIGWIKESDCKILN